MWRRYRPTAAPKHLWQPILYRPEHCHFWDFPLPPGPLHYSLACGSNFGILSILVYVLSSYESILLSYAQASMSDILVFL